MRIYIPTFALLMALTACQSLWVLNTSNEQIEPQLNLPQIRIFGGGEGMYGVLPTGKVIPWERNQTVPSNIKEISVGITHALGVTTNNEAVVIAARDSEFGEATLPANLGKVTSVAAGGWHSLALTEKKTVCIWGNDGEAFLPESLKESIDNKAIAAGYFHSLVLKNNGTVVGWASLEEGAPLEAQEAADVPKEITTPSFTNKIVSIAAGRFHSLALTENGRVFAWGSNSHKQLKIPVGLKKNILSGSKQKKAITIRASENYNLALYNDGTVESWGSISTAEEDSNEDNGVVISAMSVPKFFNTFKDIVDIAVTKNAGFILRKNGTVYAWGTNPREQYAVPNRFSPLPQSHFAIGLRYGLALRADGTVRVWDGYSERYVPYELTNPTTSNVVAIAAGIGQSIALKADGTVRAWGFHNLPPELKDPTTSNVVAIAAGDNHSLALKADGTVRAWGHTSRGGNSYGQLDVPPELRDPTTSNVVAIAAGDVYSLALKADGTIKTWGFTLNLSEEFKSPTTNNVVAITANLALKADGTLKPLNRNSQINPNFPQKFDILAEFTNSKTSNVVAITDFLALKTNGTLKFFDSTLSQEPIPAEFQNNIVAITANYGSYLILKADGTLGVLNTSTVNQLHVPEEFRDPNNNKMFIR